jgi:DNA-binding XRE family transcriptional regulator
MPDASDPSGAEPINRIVDPHGLTQLVQALKCADERRRSLDPEGTIVPDDQAELLDRRGWYFTAYQLTREYVEANKSPPAGLTQKQLAKLAGTTPSVISRLEDADYDGHSLAMLRRIAAALDKPVEIRFVSM